METTKKIPKFPWQRIRPKERWDEEVLFLDGDVYFADLIEGLDRAKSSICLETYIFEKGRLADRIDQALRRARGRGVEVEVLVDGVGSPRFWSDYGEGLKATGIRVKLYRSWPWHHSGEPTSLAERLKTFFTRIAAINRGNHRKTCVVDGSTAWIGSMNISDVHLREVHGHKAWLDAGVRIRGREIERLNQAFKRAMSGRMLQNPFQRRRSLLLLTSSFWLRRTYRLHQIWWLKRATRHIWIQTPYFVPVRPIYRALISKARKGVDVRIIVPADSDVPLLRRLSFAFYQSLLEAGVRIFEYRPTFFHQKIAHYDDWTILGSSNFNHRSILHDLEVDVVITHPENVHELWEKFSREEQESVEITLAMLGQLPWYKRMLSRVLLTLRYFS